MEKLREVKDSFVEKLNENRYFQKLKEVWERSLVNKLLILVIIGWIFFAFIFGIWDLEITRAVIDRESKLGNFGADCGEAPGWALIVIALVILIGSSISKKTGQVEKQRYIAYVFIILGLLVFIVGLGIGESALVIYGAAIGFGVLIFTLITWDNDWEDYRLIAFILLLYAIIVPLIYVQATKVIWGRVRPRDVLSNQGPYTPWIIPNWFSGNVSHPSGHTAMGWMFMPLLILVSDKNQAVKNDKNVISSLVLIIAVITWGLFVAASRVIVAAHFASDVLFSTGTAAVTTILLYKYVYLKVQRGEPIIQKRSKGTKIKTSKEEKIKKPKKIREKKTEKDKIQLPENAIEDLKEEIRKKTGFDEDFGGKSQFKEEKTKKVDFDGLDDDFPLEE